MPSVSSQPRRFTFSLSLSKEKLAHYYAGAAQDVQVREEGGLLIRFPLSQLRAHVSHEGVCGRFELTVGADNRVIEFRKIS
ncbi:MAG: DUF2835 family protein [Pseudomonadota bacterium]